MKFRIVQKEHIYAVERDEPGSLSEPVQTKGREEVIWSGECKSRDEIEFDRIPRPFGDYEGTPSEGNCDYNYSLEVEEEEGWKFVDAIEANMEVELDEDTEGDEASEGRRVW